MTRSRLLALGGLALVAVLAASAIVPPPRDTGAAPAYTPADPAHVVARVAPRDPRALPAGAPATDAERLARALAIARDDVLRAVSTDDPRYFGHARAALAAWWTLDDPPIAVLMIRASIAQAQHGYVAARADLDRVVAREPDDANAHLMRAAVASAGGDYPAARESCAAVARVAPAIVAAICIAPLDGLAHPADAAAALAARLDASADADVEVHGWALRTLAALAVQRGDEAEALRRLGAALELDGLDPEARAAAADVSLHAGRAAEASALLAGGEARDALLVRRAIAEHAARGPDAATLAQDVRDRVLVAVARGDQARALLAARFALAVDGDTDAALRDARIAWESEHELPDARVLAEAARAAHTPAAAGPVRAWADANHVVDAQLEAALAP